MSLACNSRRHVTSLRRPTEGISVNHRCTDLGSRRVLTAARLPGRCAESHWLSSQRHIEMNARPSRGTWRNLGYVPRSGETVSRFLRKFILRREVLLEVSRMVVSAVLRVLINELVSWLF